MACPTPITTVIVGFGLQIDHEPGFFVQAEVFEGSGNDLVCHGGQKNLVCRICERGILHLAEGGQTRHPPLLVLGQGCIDGPLNSVPPGAPVAGQRLLANGSAVGELANLHRQKRSERGDLWQLLQGFPNPVAKEVHVPSVYFTLDGRKTDPGSSG